MRQVAANLRLLLTCPAFLLWHVLGAVLCIPAFRYAWTSTSSESGAYVAVLAVPVWSAFVLTSLQKDLMVQPFGFGLPGHRDALRRTAFLVGIAVSVVACLPALAHPEVADPGPAWTAWSAFCFGLVVYLVVVGFLLSVDNTMLLLVPLVPLVAAGGVLIEIPRARILVQEVALSAPGWNSAVLAALSLLVWRRMGSVDRARRACGRRFLSLLMAWRRTAGEEFWERGKRESLSKRTWSVRGRLLERSFARIGRRPALSLRRSLAALQYELAGRLVPQSPWSVPVVVVLALLVLPLAGYIPLSEDGSGAPAANGLYTASCVVGSHLPIPMYRTLLLPAGRRERFWSALAIAAGHGLVVLGLALLTFLLLLAMGTFAPPLSLGGETLRFHTADLGPALIPFLVLPIDLVLKLVCKTWLLVPEVLLWGTAMLLIVDGGAAVRNPSPLVVATLLAVGWGMLVAVIHSYSFRRDLVRG